MKNLTRNALSKKIREEVKSSKDAVWLNYKLTLKGKITLEAFTSWLMHEVETLQSEMIYVSNKVKKGFKK